MQVVREWQQLKDKRLARARSPSRTRRQRGASRERRTRLGFRGARRCRLAALDRRRGDRDARAREPLQRDQRLRRRRAARPPRRHLHQAGLLDRGRRRCSPSWSRRSTTGTSSASATSLYRRRARLARARLRPRAQTSAAASRWIEHRQLQLPAERVHEARADHRAGEVPSRRSRRPSRARCSTSRPPALLTLVPVGARDGAARPRHGAHPHPHLRPRCSR